MSFKQFLNENKVLKTFVFKGASVDLKKRDPGVLTLTNLESKNRNSGEAKKVMEMAIKWAQENGFSLILNAVPDDDTDTERLIKFYQSFGFKKSGPFNQMTLTNH